MVFDNLNIKIKKKRREKIVIVACKGSFNLLELSFF